MVWVTRYYRIAGLLALAALAGCASGPPPEAVHSRAARRVVAAYNIPDLLAQAGPAVTAALDKNLPEDVPAAKRRRLHKIVTRAYARQPLASDVARRLRTNALDARHERDLGAADKTLHGTLAQRMIALQQKISGRDFARGFKRFVHKPVTDERKRRIKIVRSLAADMRISQLQTDFNLTLLAAMIRARNAAVGADQRATDGQIERLLDKARHGIRARLDQQVPLMLLYAYRSVDTPALQRYAELQARPAMVRVNTALDRAVRDTLAAAGAQIPKRFQATKE